MENVSDKPITLGDKIRMQKLGRASKIPHIFLISPTVGVLVWWGLQSIELGIGSTAVIAVLFALQSLSRRFSKSHILISHDQQGFMPSLRLSDKTVIFDGNNIYHFGREHGVGTKVLKILIQKLRSDGFRVVCFFDANIFFTLLENNEFNNGRDRFSIGILQNLFGLRENEIYVVPNGRQADEFILESLDLLPISFVITNDRFRDFEDKYEFLREGKEWRKGVTVKNGDFLLYNYNFREAS